MEKQIISVRLPADKVAALDSLAESLDRDRSYLVNEAVDGYLETQRYHGEQIEQGLKDAKAGRWVEHSEAKKILAKLRRRK